MRIQKYYIPLIILIMIAFNALLAFQNFQLKNLIVVKEEMIRLKNLAHNLEAYRIPPVMVKQLDRDEEILLNRLIERNQYSILLLFSPSDCGTCLEEKSLWNKLAKINGIEVIGISHHPYAKELKDYVSNAELKFDVFQDSESQVVSWFKPTKTPVKLLVDRNGNVLMVDYVRYSEKERNNLIKVFRNFVES